MPVLLREHGLDHVAPLGLHRADDVELASCAWTGAQTPAIARPSAPGPATDRLLPAPSRRSPAFDGSMVATCSRARRPQGRIITDETKLHRPCSASRPCRSTSFSSAAPATSTWRKLMPALFQAFRHGKLPAGGRILAVARDERSDDDYRAFIQRALRRGRPRPSGRPTRSSRASPRCCTTGAWTCRSPADYAGLKAWLDERARRHRGDVPGDRARTCSRVMCAQLGARRPERPAGARGAGKAARPRPGQRAGDQPRGARAPSASTRPCASTTTSASRRCRTCWRCASATRCSSRCGGARASPTSRSRWPRRSASARAATSTTAPARCATWSRTMRCSC